ncbi:MAG: TIGR04211 family SH3 domain-containing protein [Deltaproteobacteria bacterium]|nr:TIGR04211 family SH3 domain-containing protein [Deltaproteobacteria bacterium]
MRYAGVKYAGVLFGCILLITSTVYAKTMYVTDVFEVMVRTGPAMTNKIIAMPRSGTAVEIVEVPDEQRVDEWVKVRLANGKEGWMLSQFLVPGPPKNEVIATLKKKTDTLQNRVKTLQQENARLSKLRKELESALAQQTTRSKALERDYEMLKTESKDFLALKASYEKASRELNTKTSQVESLEKELQKLRNSQTLRWFVAGASIILVGFIIGYASRRPKRRSSLL